MNTPQNPHSRANPNSRRANAAKSSIGEWTEVLLFYLLPFLLFNGILFVLVTAKPKITIQVANTKDYKNTTASITVQSLFPIKEFSSAQEGTPLLLTETNNKGHYTADIIRNGVIEIYAKGLNGMAVTEYEHVNILDDVAPLVGEEYTIQDGVLSLTLEDSQSGVDYQSVYAITSSGQAILPLSLDKQTGIFTFPMEEDFLVIYANDLAGNGMQATFSTHIETLNAEEVPAANAAQGSTLAAEGNAALFAEGTIALPAEETAASLAGENAALSAGENTALPAGENTALSAGESAALPAETASSTQTPPSTQPETETEEEITIYIRTQ